MRNKWRRRARELLQISESATPTTGDGHQDDNLSAAVRPARRDAKPTLPIPPHTGREHAVHLEK